MMPPTSYNGKIAYSLTIIVLPDDYAILYGAEHLVAFLD